MLAKFFLCLLPLMEYTKLQTAATKVRPGSRRTSEMLEILFTKQRYDPRIRPNVDGDPVQITTGFWVLSIDSVSVTDMAFGLDIFLRQNWTDNRLDIGLNQTLSLGSSILSEVWVPDTYFKNAKQSNFHEVTAKNLMLRIGPKGRVHYNTRVTLKVLCIMDLRLYPFDVQHCPLNLESYGYGVDDIMYHWERRDEDGMTFVPTDAKVLPQFRLIDLRLSSQFTSYIVGNWSGVTATFKFQRTYSFYVIQIYGPSALIVVLSWISFLLPRDQSPARVTLGVTSVLTVVTVFTMSNQAMPRVNYVKAIDKYLITCFLFVFASLVEYALLLTFVYRQNQHRDTNQLNQKKSSSSSSIINGEPPKIPKQLFFSRKMDLSKSSLSLRKPSQAMKEFCRDQERRLCHDDTRCFYRDDNIKAIDRYSLRIFPLAFVLFNLYYWICIFNFPNLIISR